MMGEQIQQLLADFYADKQQSECFSDSFIVQKAFYLALLRFALFFRWNRYDKEGSMVNLIPN